jgi:hypothetical protein
LGHDSKRAYAAPQNDYNEVANEPQRQIDENYQGNIGRLTQLKNKYDPTNLFRLNANVKPTI